MGRSELGHHAHGTLCAIAAKLARVLELPYEMLPPIGDASTYWIPLKTLVGHAPGQPMPRHEHAFFGGWVPWPFLPTKVVSHGLVDGASVAPAGWHAALAAALGDSVLPGFSCFSMDDAAKACTRLLRLGPVRIKDADGIGGGGQFVVRNRDEADAIVQRIWGQAGEPGRPALRAVVCEQHLSECQTYSVGECRLPGLQMAYVGRQRTRASASGKVRYAGSDLVCFRGPLSLLSSQLPHGRLREVVRQAQHYDAQIQQHYPSLLASRRNYDIACGYDHAGGPRSGVLEQSWRVGGATPAEVMALQALVDDPRRDRIVASCHELDGLVAVPEGAALFYRGHDPRIGALTKFARIMDGR